MVTWLIFVLGVFAGAVFMAAYLAKPDRTVPSAPEPQPVEAQAAPDPPGDETVTAKLHRLAGEMEYFAENTAHPMELRDRREFQDAVALLADATAAPTEIVRNYAIGATWVLACASFVALPKRDDRHQVLKDTLAHLHQFRPWTVYYALRYISALEERPTVGAAFASVQDWWHENLIIPGAFKDYLDARQAAGDEPVFGDALSVPYAVPVAQIRKFLTFIDHDYARSLIEDLGDSGNIQVDTAYLSAFGRFWTPTHEGEALVLPESWKPVLAEAEGAILQAQPRSVLVLGENRTGKTAFLKLLATKFMADGWSVFEASGADLMSGQKYIGELEERVRRTMDELQPAKKAIWYVPDLAFTATAGKHQGQPASILDQILPAIQAGRLIILSEATLSAAARLIQERPAVRGAFELTRLPALSEVQTEELLGEFSARLKGDYGLAVAPETSASVMELVRQYLGTHELPGAAIDLIKLTANRLIAGGLKQLQPGDILQTLAQQTGLPRSILDTNEKLELAHVRREFSARIVGQEEAVNAVVDRIAMLKAGLTDPNRPVAVFLFAGPTGTGKTELAKTLARYLFGSAERLLRLDMSEFQGYESTRKIIGDADNPSTGSLTHKVRKQPFSVILLDEFEKAHANIWDLFLQVFDDGRLTDAQGITADFRHCIVIMTSNLGATAHKGMDVGFTPPDNSFSSEQILKSIGQTFRPEFVNRLDKVIVFQPLSRAVMREILRKELKDVLDRRGLKNREWAVEWENSALEFLLNKGFSAEMGARPLKRAIDHYLLAPLAATIVEHRFPEGGQFLFVRSDSTRIQVEFVDPDADGPVAPEGARDAGPSLASMILSPDGDEQERALLAAKLKSLQDRIEGEAWTKLALELSEAMSALDFWKRADRRLTLSQVALVDRVKAALRTAVSLHERLNRSAQREGRASRELTARVAQQLFLVEEGMTDVETKSPVEVILEVAPAQDGGAEAVQWAARLREMYRAWANRRGMQLSVVVGPDGQELCLVSGFGAARRLAEEAGLHSEEDGAAARVSIAPAPLDDLPANQAFSALAGCLQRAAGPQHLVRRYRDGDAPLVRDLIKGWRTGNLDRVLAGDFDLIGLVKGA